MDIEKSPFDNAPDRFSFRTIEADLNEAKISFPEADNEFMAIFIETVVNEGVDFHGDLIANQQRVGWKGSAALEKGIALLPGILSQSEAFKGKPWFPILKQKYEAFKILLENKDELTPDVSSPYVREENKE